MAQRKCSNSTLSCDDAKACVRCVLSLRVKDPYFQKMGLKAIDRAETEACQNKVGGQAVVASLLSNDFWSKSTRRWT